MVRISKDNKIHFKILYWGAASSGKTTAVDTLFKICKNQDKDVEPIGTLTKIAMSSGATLYFDRGIFQSKNRRDILFHTYTVAGQTRLQPIRKKVFDQTDGVIFVVDSQRSRLESNIESLKELKRVAEGKLIKEIPLFFMINKRDLDDIITLKEWEDVLKEEGLLYDPEEPLSKWNPVLYESIALLENYKNVYRIFSEIAHRCVTYQNSS